MDIAGTVGGDSLLKNGIEHLKQGTFFEVVSKKKFQIFRNINNIVKYGPAAPKFEERIWVNPCKINTYFKASSVKTLCGVAHIREVSGKVIEANWPFDEAIPIIELFTLKTAIQHWVYEMPWKETGEYEYVEGRIKDKGQHIGCKNVRDIIKRYEDLDLIFEQAKRDGRLRTVEEINAADFIRGSNPCGSVHIGPNGELYWGYGDGQHRFAIAYILKIPLHAQIGCVHIDAIPYLNNMRQKNWDHLKKALK